MKEKTYRQIKENHLIFLFLFFVFVFGGDLTKQNILLLNFTVSQKDYNIENVRQNCVCYVNIYRLHTDPQIYKNLFYDILINQYYSYDRIYTDGSKDDVSVSSASVPFNREISVQNQRIPSINIYFTQSEP